MKESDTAGSRIGMAILDLYPERLLEFELALHTGLRLSEQYGARWEQVNWEQRVLTIPHDKGGRSSYVPLNSEALGALKELHARRTASGELVCGGAVRPRVWFETCREPAGLADFTWHGLRHTFASRLVMSGADVRTVAELLRHRTLAMVMRYAHLAPDYRMAAVERMQQKFSKGGLEGLRLAESKKSGTQSGMTRSRRGRSVH